MSADVLGVKIKTKTRSFQTFFFHPVEVVIIESGFIESAVVIYLGDELSLGGGFKHFWYFHPENWGR